MDHEETAVSRPPSPKAETIAAPSDAELSRIAREAVHQPADPRLDRQLARMIGVMDPSASADSRPAQPNASPAVVSAADLERVRARLRFVEMVVGALVATVVILGLAVGLLLLR